MTIPSVNNMINRKYIDRLIAHYWKDWHFKRGIEFKMQIKHQDK